MYLNQLLACIKHDRQDTTVKQLCTGCRQQTLKTPSTCHSSRLMSCYLRTNVNNTSLPAIPMARSYLIDFLTNKKNGEQLTPSTILVIKLFQNTGCVVLLYFMLFDKKVQSTVHTEGYIFMRTLGWADVAIRWHGYLD